MLSNDLAAAADWIAGHVRRDEPIPVHAAACLAQSLMDLAARAEQMEILPFRLSSPEVSLGFKRKRASAMSTDRANTPVPDELAAVRAELKRLETREAELKRLLLDNPDLRTGAAYLAEIKTVSQQRTDLKELRAMHKDLLDEYTFPVEITRVELRGISEDGEILSLRKLAKIGSDQ